jgi:hypothetical protein
MAENVGRRGSTWNYRLVLPPDGDGRRRQKQVSGLGPNGRPRRRSPPPGWPSPMALARDRAFVSLLPSRFSEGDDYRLRDRPGGGERLGAMG